MTDLNKSLQLAARILSGKDLSKQDLSDRLLRKNIKPDIVSETIDYLCEKKWYDEFKSACEIAQTKLRRSPVGSAFMVEYLLSKKFPEYLVSQVTDKVYQEKSEKKLAEQIAKKRFPTLLQKFDGDKEKINYSVINYLLSKGFSEHVCEEVVDDIECLFEQ